MPVKEKKNIKNWSMENTRSAIDSLCKIKHKENCAFIALDIKDFNPSVREAIRRLTLPHKYVKNDERSIK